jgi:hypothetical protein
VFALLCAVGMPLAPTFEASAKGLKPGEATGCEPGSDQVAFFQDKNFKGACSMRGVGSYPDAAAMGIRKAQLSSLKVGSALQVVLCRNVAFTGNCQLFTGDAPSLFSTQIGDNRVSSAEVQPRGHQDCVPGPQQVALFMHRGFLAPCEIRDVGEYPDLATAPALKNAVSSIRVGQDVQAILCRRASFEGDCELFVASDDNLNDDRIGNDNASSLKVQVKGLQECMPKMGEAALFKHPEFLAPCVIRTIGDYATAEAIGLSDNSIAAVRLGPGVQVCACESAAFAGTCRVFVNDAPGVGSHTGIISSVRVQPAGAACQGATPAPIESTPAP